MNYIVYTGQSRLKGEEGCMTIGISKDGFRREYSKIMVITQVLPAQSLRHARAIEKVGIQYMDTVCHRTFVNGVQMNCPLHPIVVGIGGLLTRASIINNGMKFWK